ncbi:MULTISPECIES: IS607 family transposase [Moorena]|uniref:DNA binding domain, excisionase family n=1 Tax=Moorena producens 3L TaxID=489825 RepID=F4XP07_9CYAN|nr:MULTISPECIES: IS607 family transposase [Moorena]NEQ15736.1 IS607 family transposase [Moorena sp. SIO3E2]EGJ33778.1 DNA binding domain, excisionase family [Moorena producens 3L]NEP32882.1 IS607 family transposase [Moorena sp. SIO3B2]NEP69497.1 IS607 family transposase [Moorena sp. SIO3A5]NER88214.1 IS607 family transposase [Moorena sp. SIO3A2]
MSGLTISIGEAASELGVSVKTLRRWADAGKIRSKRSPSGHRRFYVADIKHITPRNVGQIDDRITINYARVSDQDQKEDLVKQIKILESFSTANGWQYETIQDSGAGINSQNKGLQKLLKRIMQGNVGRVVITHKDRLLRVSAELVFAMCQEFNTEVIIINKSSEDISVEQELVKDIMELITIFSEKLHSAKSSKT